MFSKGVLRTAPYEKKLEQKCKVVGDNTNNGGNLPIMIKGRTMFSKGVLRTAPTKRNIEKLGCW
jgi:hypothetical protein